MISSKAITNDKKGKNREVWNFMGKTHFKDSLIVAGNTDGQ